MSSPFTITTAIDYPSGSPHMGHAYEKIVSDAYARWHRLMGEDVFFLTGTDENGQKLARTAEKANQKVHEFVDEQVLKFQKLCKDLEISNQDFIRTTEKRHIEMAQKFWTTLEENNDIYFGEYEGFYCIECEAFYPKTQAPDLKCPTHGLSLESVKEQGYFLKLGAYQDWIIDFIKSNPSFIFPTSARKEILSRLEGEPLKDLSISRPNTGWGIPVPSNENFVMYTWFDALINYYTATQGERAHYWPASMHVIGKDIIWFHCVIWPVMLEACKISLPKQIYVHGMILGSDGRKMSKSLNNGVDPYDVLQDFPVDSFRYYLLRAFPSGVDSSFSVKALLSRHNNELANDFGNLMMRVAKLSQKNFGNTLKNENFKQELQCDSLASDMNQAMEKREHHKALDLLWEKVNETNQYLNDKAPWKLKENPAQMKEVLFNGLYALTVISTNITPFLPSIGSQALQILGQTVPPKHFDTPFATLSFTFPEVIAPLFPKIEKTF